MNTQKNEENNNGELNCNAKKEFVGSKKEDQKEYKKEEFDVSKTAEEEKTILNF